MAASSSTSEHPASSSHRSSYRQFVSSIVRELAQALAASEQSLNPLTTSDRSVKHILLTLHTLFPDELLPALDILDRRLVLRYNIKSPAINQDEASNTSKDRSKMPGLVRGDHSSITSRDTSLDQGQERDEMGHLRSEMEGRDLEGQAASSSPDPNTTRDTNIPILGTLPRRQVASLFAVRSGRQQGNSNRSSKWKDATAESVAHYEVRLGAWSCSCPAFSFSAFPASARRQSQAAQLVNSENIGGRSLGDSVPVCKHILACLLVDKCQQFSQFVEEINVSIEEMVGLAAGYDD